MEIYGKGSSRSFRCLWAAEEAGLDYRYIDVVFGGEGENGTNSDTYRQLNSQGKVPTLVDESYKGKADGQPSLVLTESAAILNYIAMLNPNSNLMPLDDSAAQRALYDQLVFFVLSDLEQPLWTNGKHRFALPKDQRVPEVLDTTLWEFNKSQKALVEIIGESPDYAFGDHFTMADIAIAHTLSWAESFKFELFDGLKAYKNRMYERAACQRAVAKLEA